MVVAEGFGAGLPISWDILRLQRLFRSVLRDDLLNHSIKLVRVTEHTCALRWEALQELLHIQHADLSIFIHVNEVELVYHIVTAQKVLFGTACKYKFRKLNHPITTIDEVNAFYDFFHFLIGEL